MDKTFTTALAGEGKAFPLARFAGLLLKGSVSLDSQSPKGSLRIQFPCHPASGGRAKLREAVFSQVTLSIVRVVVPPHSGGKVVP